MLALYGTDMYADTSSGPAPICPTSNVLDIKNVEYKASHLNVHTDDDSQWTTFEGNVPGIFNNVNNDGWNVMPENYAGRNWVFQESGDFLGNVLGIGDDITARLRLNIPSPCKGNFIDGGELVFVGTVI